MVGLGVLAGELEKAWKLKFENSSEWILGGTNFACDLGLVLHVLNAFFGKIKFGGHGGLLGTRQRRWVWSSVLGARVSVWFVPEGALRGFQHDLLSWV